jgi:hypothetical protein
VRRAGGPVIGGDLGEKGREAGEGLTGNTGKGCGSASGGGSGRAGAGVRAAARWRDGLVGMTYARCVGRGVASPVGGEGTSRTSSCLVMLLLPPGPGSCGQVIRAARCRAIERPAAIGEKVRGGGGIMVCRSRVRALLGPC